MTMESRETIELFGFWDDSSNEYAALMSAFDASNAPRRVSMASESRRFLWWRVCRWRAEYDAVFDDVRRSDTDDETTFTLTFKPVCRVVAAVTPWWERLAFRVAWLWS